MTKSVDHLKSVCRKSFPKGALGGDFSRSFMKEFNVAKMPVEIIEGS